MNTSVQWYRATVGDDSENAAALRAGIAQRTLNRQLQAGALSPEVAVAIADAYGRDAVEALILTGLITREHVRRHGALAALADASDDELAREVGRRLRRLPSSGTVFD